MKFATPGIFPLLPLLLPQDVESIFRAASEAALKQPSFTAETEMTSEAMGMQTRMTGKVFIADENRMRMEFSFEAPMKGKGLVVSDGTWLWSQAPDFFDPEKPIVQRGRLEAVKAQAPPGPAGAARGPGVAPTPGQIVESAREAFAFEYKGEEVWDGVKVWVVEGKAREDAPAPEGEDPMSAMWRKMQKFARLKIGQQNGFAYVFEAYADLEKPPIVAHRYRKVVLRPKLDPALFTYSPPPGVPIVDMTPPEGKPPGGG